MRKPIASNTYLHVAVTVRAEPGRRGDDVVVVDQQQAVGLVLAVVVLAEVHRVLGIEPADVGEESVFWLLDRDAHDSSNNIARATIPQGRPHLTSSVVPVRDDLGTIRA